MTTTVRRHRYQDETDAIAQLARELADDIRTFLWGGPLPGQPARNLTRQETAEFEMLAISLDHYEGAR